MKKILHLLLITVLIYFLFFENNKEGLINCDENDNNELMCNKYKDCYFYRNQDKDSFFFSNKGKCINKVNENENCRKKDKYECIAEDKCLLKYDEGHDPVCVLNKDGQNEPLIKVNEKNVNYTYRSPYRGIFSNNKNGILKNQDDILFYKKIANKKEATLNKSEEQPSYSKNVSYDINDTHKQNNNKIIALMAKAKKNYTIDNNKINMIIDDDDSSEYTIYNYRKI